MTVRMTGTPQTTNPNDAPLRDQVRSAVIWRSGTQILGQLITWSSTFLVIRILSPSDYGIYSMSAVLLALLGMINGFGLANALIQKREVTPHMLRQLFGMLILLNALLALIQIIAAPYVAAYYKQPIIADMLYVQSLIYITNPFLAMGYAILSREMDFRKQAQVNLISGILAALAAVTGAFLGLGIWTLVFAPLVGFASRAFGTAYAARAFILPSFRFDGAWSLLVYGGIVTVGQFFWFIQTQADVIIGGRMLTPHMLGIYTTALFLTQLFVTKFVPPLNEVAFSAYARIQDDKEAMKRSFLLAVRLIMLVGIPFYLGLSATADATVKIVLGSKWLETAPVIQLLGFAMPFITLHVIFTPAVNAMGRPGVETAITAIGAILLPVVFLVGIQWGLMGMTAAWLAGYPILTIIGAYWVLPIIGVKWSQLITALAPPVVAGLIMYTGVKALSMALPSTLSPLLTLILLVIAGGVLYGSALYVGGRERLIEAFDLVRKRSS